MLSHVPYSESVDEPGQGAPLALLDCTEEVLGQLLGEPFQREHYTPEKRPFVNDILAHCQNPTQAFANWMDRDVGFAKRIAQQAQELDLKGLTVDGRRTIEQNAEMVAKYFRLE